ncbi:hypothetical protein N9X88_05400 [Alphaproteobacteria bacterium]|nr:hypothetical protein [Alphaproteobacteria bacterium]
MKKLIRALLLTGLLAGCASNTVVNSAGVKVPTLQFENKYYQTLGSYRKATFIQHDRLNNYFSNAYKVSEQTDEFRDTSWRWYYPQTGFVNLLGSIKPDSSYFSIYFPRNGEKWSSPFLHTDYFGSDWLFFDTISVKAGNKKPITLASGKFITERDVLDGGFVREVYNSRKGAREFLNYMRGVPDKAPIEVRQIATGRQNQYKAYSFINNKPVIDEMLALLR